MATFTSIQTGNWHTASTWNQGAVPNLSVDDVVISAGHTVTFGAGQYATLAPGRMIAVLAGGTLRIQGAVDAYNSLVIVLGTLIVEGGDYLYVWGGGQLSIEAGGTLTITSNFYVASTAIMTVYGQVTIQAGAYTDFFDYANLTLEVGGTIQTYSTFFIEWSSQATIRDDFSIENGGYLNLNDNTVVTIESGGAVFVYGTLAMSWSARSEVFGYFGVASTGLLSVLSTALINVYKDIRVGGRVTGGGKIVMLRREGRILDFSENPVFVLDRAYGFSKALAA